MYVEMKDICKTFDGFQASDHVSFGIEKGQMAALLGPSGSGKTTILRMIAGLDRPDSGDIMIKGFRVNDLPGNKRGIGFVFQNYALFRYMTVADNIGFGLEVQKKSKAEIKARVEELLELISMEDLGKRYPHQLSGGQRQRVAFARALAPDPGLLLLDEPVNGLDFESTEYLYQQIAGYKQYGTVLFSSHILESITLTSDRVFVLENGQIRQTFEGGQIHAAKIREALHYEHDV